MEGNIPVNMGIILAERQAAELATIRKMMYTYIKVTLDEDKLKEFIDKFNNPDDKFLVEMK